MNFLDNSSWEYLPLPIYIGLILWIFSIITFLFFLVFIFVLLNQNSSKFNDSIILENFHAEDKLVKSTISADSLILGSNEKKDKSCSFYLNNPIAFQEKEKGLLKHLPTIQLQSIKPNENKEKIDSLQVSRRRSIVKDLNTLTNSFKEKTLHQSIDSLFSKDSLVQ